jgi:hypothetical protein
VQELARGRDNLVLFQSPKPTLKSKKKKTNLSLKVPSDTPPTPPQPLHSLCPPSLLIKPLYLFSYNPSISRRGKLSLASKERKNFFFHPSLAS